MKYNFILQKVYCIISIIVFSIWSINLSAQTVNFTYSTSGLSTSDCNIFDPPIAVQSYAHTSFAGGPTFNGSSIYVPVVYSTVSNVLAGTGYAISYPFTATHGYAMSFNVTANINNSAASLPYFKVGLSSSLPSKSLICGGWPGGYSNTQNLSFASIYNNILSATNQNIQIPAFIGAGQSNMLIGTYPSSTVSSYLANVYIGSISISDVPPITPSTASLQCSGSTQVLSVNTPYPVSWTSSSANVPVVGSGPNYRNGTVTAGNISGLVTITAIVATPNGSVNLTRQVAVGAPVINISYSLSGACSGSTQGWLLNASSPSSVTSWKWTIDQPGSCYVDNSSSPNTYASTSTRGGISVVANNACGTNKDGVTIYSNCTHSAITAIPNPTKNNVTIAVAEPKGTFPANKNKVSIYQIKITDQLGNLKKQYKPAYGTNNVSISLNGLINGIYTIWSFDGSTWSSVKVVKQ